MSFPNSEQLFRTAFNQPNPSSTLLNLIKQNSTYLSIVKLVAIYANLVDENLTRAEALASILLQVRGARPPPSTASSFPRSSAASWPTFTSKHCRPMTTQRRWSLPFS
ncbi:hypothetical protein BDN70DRAFT_446573 [Pholiota conissans]|uniref:Uncharacterized protein n=1 Tax=Pholiota conissans TaxID=109636 RepID=A0A9P5YRL2_9AGAR|nr:hypothetical protein BDN70DRAFT_446573 [Pholiota conissans]